MQNSAQAAESPGMRQRRAEIARRCRGAPCPGTANLHVGANIDGAGQGLAAGDATAPAAAPDGGPCQRFLILNRAPAGIIEVSLKKPLAFCRDERWGARFRRRGDARPAGAGRLRARLLSGRRARAVAARGRGRLHEVGRGQARRRRGADRADPGARHLRRRFSAQGFRARRAAGHELRRLRCRRARSRTVRACRRSRRPNNAIFRRRASKSRPASTSKCSG